MHDDDCIDLEALCDLREYQDQQSQNKNTACSDQLICECKCISAFDIREALIFYGKKNIDLEFLKRHLGLGTGCGSCLRSFKSWEKQIFKSLNFGRMEGE